MLSTVKDDLSASIVVFFVAVPLCLGIALASGAPLFSGIIAGIVGGIVVGMLSNSPLGVSGPAAGLAVIVLNAITSLGSWEIFLSAVVIAGFIQVILGFVNGGFIAYFFPSSVIRGMLCGIGLLIIIKQIPVALGYDKDIVSDLVFYQLNGSGGLGTIKLALSVMTEGAVLISVVSLAILILWDKYLTKKHKFFQLLQGPIVVVVVGIAMNTYFESKSIYFSLSHTDLVQLPVVTTITEFFHQLAFPDFSAIFKVELWKTAFVLAIVASLETLLCVEATDKLDPYKRVTHTNRELQAQGIGNIVSGLCGGLPLTQVIVRSSANINFGAKTKLSTIMHGIWILLSVITISEWLNKIPLASLAAILMMVGYHLTKPALYIKIYKSGAEQFIPFMVTIIGILATDLLQGILMGLGCGILFTLHHSYRNAYYMRSTINTDHGRKVYHLVLAEEVSFFNKASIMEALDNIPPHSKVTIDCTNSKSIAHDVVELINNFKENASVKNITVDTINFHNP